MEPEQAPRPLHYGPVAALLVTVVGFFGSQLLAGSVVGFVPVLLGKSPKQAQAWLDSGVAPQALVVCLSALFTLLILRWFLKRRGDSFASLGFGHIELNFFWRAALGFMTYLALYVAVITAVKALVPALDLQQKQDLGFDFSVRSAVPLLVLSLVIVPPLLEEVMMRGFLFGGLRTKLPFIGATLVTSGLFAAAHLPEGKGGLLWVGAIDTFILSLVLCYLREKTGSLWPSIFVHAAKNSVALAYLVYLR